MISRARVQKPVTWVYDGGSYTPVAKLTEEDSYTIVQNRLMERDMATTRWT